MQLDTPSVVPIAVRIAIMSWIPYLMISFLFIVYSSLAYSAATAVVGIGVHWIIVRRIGTSAVVIRIRVPVLILLNGAVVGTGHLLHHLSVAVVARDVDRRVPQFLLDVHTRGEDHLAGGDEA